MERSGICAHGAALIQTGIGAARVRTALPTLLRRRPAGLVSIGVAGGLNASLTPGTVLLPQEILAETGERFPISASWRARVCARLPGPPVESGALISVAHAARTPADKRDLAEQFGAVAVDMESAALARLAQQHAVPFIVIRAVADPHDTPIPAVAGRLLTPDGAVRWSALPAALLQHPKDIGALIALAMAFRSAARALDTSCRHAGQTLCRPDRTRLP